MCRNVCVPYFRLFISTDRLSAFTVPRCYSLWDVTQEFQYAAMSEECRKTVRAMTAIRIRTKSKAERINKCMKINQDSNEGTGFTTVQFSSDVCYLMYQEEESQVEGHYKDILADVYPYLFCHTWYTWMVDVTMLTWRKFTWWNKFCGKCSEMFAAWCSFLTIP